MATPSMTPNPGGTQPGAAPQAPQGSQPAGGGMQSAKILASISQLAKMAAQAIPSASPEMQQIDQLAQQAATKMMAAMKAGQNTVPTPPM